MIAQNEGHTAVTGIQFGDEGKGQIVDLLAESHQLNVRYNGGANAGHSVYVGGVKHALHLVPSGILHPGVVNVVANGVVVDPFAMIDEITELRDAGVSITSTNLCISHRAHLVLPYHKVEDGLLDRAMSVGEPSSEGTLLYTTKKGIGPCYADRAHRSTAVRVVDLLDDELLAKLLPRVVEVKNAQLAAWAALAGEAHEPVDAAEVLRAAASRGRRILFEGANASLLDVDFGTFPYVTSSNCSVAAIANATGLTVPVANSVGVAKVYMSRVGSGPFPTESDGPEADLIRDRAHEYGTTTGRPRRIGWLDLVALRHTSTLNATSELVLTGLPFLHGVDPIRVCVAYELDGREINFPASARELSRVVPRYETLAGFEAPLSDCRSSADLPETVHTLVSMIERTTDARVSAVCTGKGRGEIVQL
ncbi:MAG: adenylosuccinate synthase [Spirochaetota bacterium]